MIDEELYQFATDELNSDRRDTELWNRACALARDDHDEARFLYTNLRVEELLEQKANGEPMPEMPDSVKGAASDAFDLDAAPNAIDSAPLGLGSALNASNDTEETETLSSSNRAFSADSNTDLSEDMILDLQSSNAANTSEDDALPLDHSQLSTESTDENKVSLDPLVFSGFNPDADSPSGAEAATEFELDAAAALNIDHSDTPSQDMDIASLAAQASAHLQGNADSLETTSLEDALDTAGSLDNTAYNTDKLDSIAAETGAFEPMDSSSAANTATPLPYEADLVPESTSLNENELAFLDASIDKGRDDIIDQQREVLHQKDALTEELERQADSFLPEDSTSVVSELDESDLVSNAVDIDSVNTRSANIEAVAETIDTPISSASAAAASDLDDVFSDSNLEQIRAQNNAVVPDFDSEDIDALAQNNPLSDYAGEAAHVVSDSSDAVSTMADDVTDNLSSGVAGTVGGIGGAVAAGGAALASTAVLAKDQGAQISQDFSQPGNLNFDDNNPSLDQAELLSGKGRTYRVYSKGAENNRAVKTGVSWAALFFTLPWLLVKRMPLLAIVYALLWVVLAAGLLITGMQWLDAPKDAQNALAIWPLGFAALAVIGLILLPFFFANRWHASSLESRGYLEIALVRAKGPRRAIDRIMRMAS